MPARTPHAYSWGLQHSALTLRELTIQRRAAPVNAAMMQSTQKGSAAQVSFLQQLSCALSSLDCNKHHVHYQAWTTHSCRHCLTLTYGGAADTSTVTALIATSLAQLSRLLVSPPEGPPAQADRISRTIKMDVAAGLP